MLKVGTYNLSAISYRIWYLDGPEYGKFSLFLIFWKSLNLLDKNLCDEVSKLKNLRFHLSMLIVRTHIFFAISYRIWYLDGPEYGQFSLFFIFWKSLNLLDKNLCDEVSKLKNLRCTFFSFVHAYSQDTYIFCHI